MEWYWIVLIVGGGIIFFYFLFAFFVSTIVLKQATKPNKHTLEESRARQAEAEHVDFTAYDSVWNKEQFEVEGVQGKVVGEIIYNKNVGDYPKVAIICHGHTWNRLNSVKYAEIFFEKGYNVVIYDQAYFGESEGSYTTLGMNESADLNTVTDMVFDKFGKNAYVGLHGESMGAATVLLLLELRSDISFVIADCPFSDTMKYYRELCKEAVHLPSLPIVDFANIISKHKYGYDFRKVKPIEAVENSDVPICFIHGKADKFIYPSHSCLMYEKSKNKLSELHLVDGAGHARSHRVNHENYKKIVCDFLDKVENENRGGSN